MLFVLAAFGLFVLGGFFALTFSRTCAGEKTESGTANPGGFTRAGSAALCALITTASIAAALPALQILLGPGLLGGLIPVLDVGPLRFGFFAVALDGLSALFLTMVVFLAGLGAAHGLSPYWSDSPPAFAPFTGRQWFAFCMFAAGVTLCIAAGDALLFLAGCEMATLSLVYMPRRGPRTESRAPSRAPAHAPSCAPSCVKNTGDEENADEEESGESLPKSLYRNAAHAGMLCIVPLFAAFIYGAWPDCSFQSLAGGAIPESWKSVFYVLALLGFGSMAGIAPLRAWFHGAHPAFAASGRGQASAFCSPAFALCGVYGMWRVLALLGGAEPWWGWLAVAVGVLGVPAALIPAFAAARMDESLPHSSASPLLTGIRRDAPLLVEYASSAMSAVVFMLTGAALSAAAGKSFEAATLVGSGALMLGIFQALAAALLFLGTASARYAAEHTPLPACGPLMAGAPLTGFVFLLGALSLALIPPLAGFCGALPGLAGMAVAGMHAASAQGGALTRGLSLAANWGGVLFTALACVLTALLVCRVFAALFLRPFPVRVEPAPAVPAVPAASAIPAKSARLGEAHDSGVRDDAMERMMGGQSAILILAGLCVAGAVFATDFAALCAGVAASVLLAGQGGAALVPARASVFTAEVPGLPGAWPEAGPEAAGGVYPLLMAGQGFLLLLMLVALCVLIRRRYIRDRAVENAAARVCFEPNVPESEDAAPCAPWPLWHGGDAMSRNGVSPYYRAFVRLRLNRGFRHAGCAFLCFSLSSSAGVFSCLAG